MKLDYLNEGSDDCPLVRIYDFTTADAHRLRQTFQALAEGSVEEVRLEGVESVDGTEISFARSNRDRVVVMRGSRHFEVALGSEGWQEAAEFTEPFCNGSLGYQWLTPQARGIRLLLSKDGSW